MALKEKFEYVSGADSEGFVIIAIKITDCNQCRHIDNYGNKLTGEMAAICNHTNAVETITNHLKLDRLSFDWHLRKLNSVEPIPVWCPLKFCFRY